MTIAPASRPVPRCIHCGNPLAKWADGKLKVQVRCRVLAIGPDGKPETMCDACHQSTPIGGMVIKIGPELLAKTITTP